MEGTVFIACFVLWNTFIDGAFAGEHCYNWYHSETYYCEWGCCGDDVDRGCCSMAGLIVGCCLAGIAIIAFIVAVICCCIKHKGKPGRVIGTSTVTTTTTTTTQHYPTMQMQPMGTGTTGQPYMNYSHPYGPPPAYPNQPPPGPAYPNQPPAGPPSSAVYSDPAYPPPSAPPPPYKR